jgi:predicted dehydrogenase
VTSATLTTVITQRPVPLGHVIGHAQVSVGDQLEPVENDDWASYSLRFADGATGDLSASRVAFGTRTRCASRSFARMAHSPST